MHCHQGVSAEGEEVVRLDRRRHPEKIAPYLSEAGQDSDQPARTTLRWRCTGIVTPSRPVRSRSVRSRPVQFRPVQFRPVRSRPVPSWWPPLRQARSRPASRRQGWCRRSPDGRPPGDYDIIAAHAAKEPDRVAIVAPDRRLTYGELDRAARGVASHLRALAEEGVVVIVGMPSSARRAAVLLGALQAGLRLRRPRPRLADRDTRRHHRATGRTGDGDGLGDRRRRHVESAGPRRAHPCHTGRPAFSPGG